MDIKQIVTNRTEGYPLYSQENEFLNDKLVLVKLFNAFGAGTWYITEYEQDADMAFGYIE